MRRKSTLMDRMFDKVDENISRKLSLNKVEFQNNISMSPGGRIGSISLSPNLV
jgi:hypothetical protein